jgi:hypothetical protein
MLRLVVDEVIILIPFILLFIQYSYMTDQS